MEGGIPIGVQPPEEQQVQLLFFKSSKMWRAFYGGLHRMLGVQCSRERRRVLVGRKFPRWSMTLLYKHNSL